MAKWTRRHAALGAAISTALATASLLAIDPAYAGHIPGHIDPGGNGTVPGFDGNVVFTIDDSCLNAGDGWHATSANSAFSSSCGDATVYSADINLYSTSPSTPPGTILGTFSLAGPPNFDPTDFWPILGVLIVNGHVAGVDTDAMGPEAGQAAGGNTDWVGHNFWLQFVSGACEAGCTPPGEFDGGIDPAYISLDDINNISNPGTVIFGPPCDDPNACVVPGVPEPGTLGLILGALGGGLLARRRQRKTSS